MKKSLMVLVMLTGLLYIPSAFGSLELESEFKLPDDGNIKVAVTSTVTEITTTSGSEYLYTYQIADIGDLNISMLSIPFLTPLTEIYDFSPGAPDAGLDLVYWEPFGNPAIAALAFFSSSPSPQLTLEFKSTYDAQTVQGYVNDAQLGSLYGNLLAPLPEPATLSILALGAGILLRSKW